MIYVDLFRMPRLARLGGVAFLSGVAMATCFAMLASLPGLHSPFLGSFLAYFLLAAVAYAIAVARLEHSLPPLAVIWGFALLFRLLLLSSGPALSDDVYRYIWDGHLLSHGVSPYAYPVADPALQPYDTPLRQLVNHNWMASPYLPAAQWFFWLIQSFAPQSVLAFQVATATLDLAAGWLIMDLLRQLGLPRRRALVYLWNPLVVIEFAHGAHLDAWMIFLLLLAFWCLMRAGGTGRNREKWRLASALTLAAATLTKALPALLAPLFVRRWGWRSLAVYAATMITACSVFANNSGWGLIGPLDGKGLFGALRIYTAYWNYNSGIYHWLEVLLTVHRTPGAVPQEVATAAPIFFTKLITSLLTFLIALGTGIYAWRLDDPNAANHATRSLCLVRLATLPIGGYLLLTHTLHPWYVTLILPFLPFLLPRRGETSLVARFVWPWLYFSCAVAISYLTYIDPQNPREFYLVRQVEYLPFYLLLVWAAWPAISTRLCTFIAWAVRPRPTMHNTPLAGILPAEPGKHRLPPARQHIEEQPREAHATGPENSLLSSMIPLPLTSHGQERRFDHESFFAQRQAASPLSLDFDTAHHARGAISNHLG